MTLCRPGSLLWTGIPGTVTAVTRDAGNARFLLTAGHVVAGLASGDVVRYVVNGERRAVARVADRHVQRDIARLRVITEHRIAGRPRHAPPAKPVRLAPPHHDIAGRPLWFTSGRRTVAVHGTGSYAGNGAARTGVLQPHSRIDARFGDSGSPVFHEDHEAIWLVGIVLASRDLGPTDEFYFDHPGEGFQTWGLTVED